MDWVRAALRSRMASRRWARRREAGVYKAVNAKRRNNNTKCRSDRTANTKYRSDMEVAGKHRMRIFKRRSGREATGQRRMRAFYVAGKAGCLL
jgi:hypothetical protein